MPFKSEKQKKFLFANKPEIAKKWASKYAQGGLAQGVVRGTGKATQGIGKALQNTTRK